MLDFWSLIIRAKGHGKKFLVAESKDGKGFELFFTESNNRLPDFLTGITVEVAKKMSKASNGRFTASQALDAVLKHVNATATVLIEKFESDEAGQPNSVPNSDNGSLN